MAYDVASGTGTPDPSTQPNLISAPTGLSGLSNLQAASSTGGFVLQPVSYDPFAAGGSAGSVFGGGGASSLDLDPADSHGSSGGNLTDSDRAAMSPHGQGMFDTRVSASSGDKSGPLGTPAPPPQPEIMSPSKWGDFVANLQNGEIPFDDLPDKYKEALKGKKDDYELMRMGITQPLANLTKSLFDPSGGLGGKEGGRAPKGPTSDSAALEPFGGRIGIEVDPGMGEVLAGDKSKKLSSTPSGKFPEAQAMYAQLVAGLPDGKGGYIVPPLPPALAAAKVGSSMGESYTYLDPLAKGDPIKTKAGTVYTAHGLDQWHGDRYKAMTDWVKANGGDPNSREWQAWYGSYEMQQNHGLMAAVANLKDPTQMVPLIVHLHEGSAPKTAHIPDRQGYASAVYSGNTIFDSDTGTDIPVMGFDPKSGLRTQGPQALTAQSLLAGLGYYHNKLDGDFGPATRAATKLFQSQNRDVNGQPLKIDGLVGVGPNGKTMNALFQAYANKYGMSDKIQHLLPVTQDQDPNAIYSPGFETGGPGSTAEFTPSVLRNLNTGVARGAPSPAPPVARGGNIVNEAAKRSAMPVQLRGWTGEDISSGLTQVNPDENALFGAPTLPPGAEMAFGATSPVPGFTATTPPPSMPRPGPMEPGLGMPPMAELGVTDPTSVIDNGIASVLGAVTDLPAIRRALATAGILDPEAISDVPPGRKGWPGAGQIPKEPSYDVLSGGDKTGVSDFDSWYSHIKETQPQTQGLIQRGAKSEGVSEESYAKKIYEKVRGLESDSKARDANPENRSEVETGTKIASADNPYNGPVDRHGLPLETQERKYYFKDPATEMDMKLMNKEEFFRNYPDATEDDWRQIIDDNPPVTKRPGSGTPMSRKKERSRSAGVIV